MKRSCQIFLSIMIVGSVVIWLADMLPLRWIVSNKLLIYTMGVGYLFILLSSVVGAVTSIAFLMRSKYRARGILYPSLTIAVSMLFIIFFLVAPVTRGLKMRSKEFNFVSTGTKVVLFDPDSPNKGVTILDTSAHASRTSGLKGTCTIKNLTVDLKIADHITIGYDGHGVKMTAYSVQHDSFPYYPNIYGDEDDHISHSETSTYSAPTSTLIRINGELMNLREAADLFPRIPPQEKQK